MYLWSNLKSSRSRNDVYRSGNARAWACGFDAANFKKEMVQTVQYSKSLLRHRQFRFHHDCHSSGYGGLRDNFTREAFFDNANIKSFQTNCSDDNVKVGYDNELMVAFVIDDQIDWWPAKLANKACRAMKSKKRKRRYEETLHTATTSSLLYYSLFAISSGSANC